MKIRPLLRTDLPKRRSSATSMHIPVLFNSQKKYICDIHFSNNELCYLENGKGVPVKIKKLQLIIDDRGREDIKKEIERKQGKLKNLSEQRKKLYNDIKKLRTELEIA